MKIAHISLSDVLEKWAHFSPEQFGWATRMMFKYYARECLHDDDGDNARFCGVTRHTWVTRAKPFLTTKADFYVCDGMLRHARIDKEIGAVAENKAKKSLKITGKSAENPQKIRQNADATTNEINSLKSPTPTPTPTQEEKKEERKEELASIAGAAEEKTEDAASEMVVSIRKWASDSGGNGMNDFEARNWLRTTVRTFGQRLTANSYQKLKTDLVTGSIVGHPLRAWSGIALRMQEDEAKPKTKTKAKSEFMKMLEARSAKYEASRANGEGKANG